MWHKTHQYTDQELWTNNWLLFCVRAIEIYSLQAFVCVIKLIPKIHILYQKTKTDYSVFLHRRSIEGVAENFLKTSYIDVMNLLTSELCKSHV